MEWYIVEDLDGFVDSVRFLVFNSFGEASDTDTDVEKQMYTVNPSEKEECEKVLSHEEAKIIVKALIKKQKNKSQQHRYTLTETIFANIVNALNERMTSNILNGLVNKGLVESAFDSETNDFIFWIKDDNKNNTEKPETD
jgi:hypothetical protein